MAPPKPSARLAAMVVLTTSSGYKRQRGFAAKVQRRHTWPSVDTSNMFRPEPSSKLLNLTGFFSIWGGASTPAMVAAGVDMILVRRGEKGPDQGSRVLLRKKMECYGGERGKETGRGRSGMYMGRLSNARAPCRYSQQLRRGPVTEMEPTTAGLRGVRTTNVWQVH